MTVILYEWKTLSLTFREEYTLEAFENGVLRRIFWSKREMRLQGGTGNYIMGS